MTELQKFLENTMACSAASSWAGEKTLSEVWATCERGDWMLWLAKRAGVSKRELTAAKAECANLVFHLMKDERSRKAVEVAQAYGRGEATDQELSAAADAAAYAAYAAYAAAYAAYAAAYAAYAAADAVAADAAYAAAADAYAAAADAAAAYAARTKTLKDCADLIRQKIPLESLKISV